MKSMKSFQEKRAQFLLIAEPLIADYFSGTQSKTIFLENWRTLVGTSEFCDLALSYKLHELQKKEGDGESSSRGFAFIKAFDFIDCTRESNPECRSGDRNICFGEDRGMGYYLYLHPESQNIVMVMDDDISCCENVDEEVADGLQLLPFGEFVNLLKPQATKTVLMDANNYSRWLEIEINALSVRYSSSILPDGKWDCGDADFSTIEEAKAFYLSFIRKYAEKNVLEMNHCSTDMELAVTALLEEFA